MAYLGGSGSLRKCRQTAVWGCRNLKPSWGWKICFPAHSCCWQVSVSGWLLARGSVLLQVELFIGLASPRARAGGGGDGREGGREGEGGKPRSFFRT